MGKCGWAKERLVRFRNYILVGYLDVRKAIRSRSMVCQELKIQTKERV